MTDRRPHPWISNGAAYPFKSQVAREVEARKSPTQAESIVKTLKSGAHLDATYFLIQTLFDKVFVGAARRPVRDEGGSAPAPEHGRQEVLLGQLKPVIKGTLERVITLDWMRDAYAGGGWIVYP